MLSWNRIACFLLPWWTRKWTLDDYPVKVEVRPELLGMRFGSLPAFAYRASIEGWPSMHALGSDRDEALFRLRQQLEWARNSWPLPAPGTPCSRSIWSTSPGEMDQIDAYEELAYELASVLWGGTPLLLTDLSRIRDGCGSAPPGELEACIRAHYGIDISDLHNPTLLEVVRRIEASRQSP